MSRVADFLVNLFAAPESPERFSLSIRNFITVLHQYL